MGERKRIGVFGWGVVAPKSPDIDSFERNLARGGTWLAPFRGYGQSNFLVGYPEFDFDRYKPWFDERFPPAKFAQLREKMGPMVQFAMGSFIQSLSQNPGIESYLQSLGTKCHVYVGTGLGELTITFEEAKRFERAFHKWNEFWAAPERCSALREHLGGRIDPNAPADPKTARLGSEAWIDAKREWERYWAERSDALTR